MPRYFKVITEVDFKEQILLLVDTCKHASRTDRFDYDIIPQVCHETAIIKKDLKVAFDMENIDSSSLSDTRSATDYISVLSNGMVYAGFEAGGDWEDPLFFLLYWDGKRVRGYIPTDGNTFNKQLKTAYGSEGESPKFDETKEGDYETLRDNAGYIDDNKLIVDIMNRIQPDPS